MCHQSKNRLPASLALLISLVTTFFLAASDNVAAQTKVVPEAKPTTSPAKEVVVAPTARDSDIAKRLTSILRASGWFYGARAAAREGIVFLDGRTKYKQHRDWAGDVARNTQDVVAVVNRIEVEPHVEWDFTPAWREMRNIAVQTQQLLPLLVLATLVLIVSWYLSKTARNTARWALRERIQSPLLLQVASRLIAFPVFLLGFYLVLQVSGLTRLAMTVLGGTGLLGIVLGFAFRDIAENFLASLLLSMRNPFNAGDLIEVGEHQGIVQNLNTRSTVLLTLDGNHIQIPNATVFKSVIKNFTSNNAMRAEFVVGIGYDDPVSRAQEVIVRSLAEHPAVLDDPEPMALVDELASSTVNLRMYFWFDNTQFSRIKLTSALMRQIKLALLQAGVSMPDEAREVIFPQGVPLLRGTPQEDRLRKDGDVEAKSTGDELDASVGEGDLSADEKNRPTSGAAFIEPRGARGLLAESQRQFRVGHGRNQVPGIHHCKLSYQFFANDDVSSRTGTQGRVAIGTGDRRLRHYPARPRFCVHRCRRFVRWAEG